MECPKCKQDFGEMITICPVCFVDIEQAFSVSARKDRKAGKAVKKADEKSKGLLESALSSLFNKSEGKPQEKAKKREKKTFDRNRLNKSISADYASFSIDTGYSTSLEITSVSMITTPPAPTTYEAPSYEIQSDYSVSQSSLPVPESKAEVKPFYKPPSGTDTVVDKEKKANEHYQRARNYEQQNRLKEALLEYGQAIAFKPQWSEPYFRAALILIKNKDYSKALENLNEVVKLRPNDADAYYQIGKIYLNKNIKEDAARYFKIALKNNPRLKAAQTELENIYQKASSAVQQVNCKNCGAFQPARAKFCGNCGGRVQ